MSKLPLGIEPAIQPCEQPWTQALGRAGNRDWPLVILKTYGLGRRSVLYCTWVTEFPYEDSPPFFNIYTAVYCYKPEGRGFDSRWCHWNFLLTKFCRLHYGHGVDSACNGNEYQEYILRGKGGRCIGLTTLPASCADFLEVWELQTSGTLRVSPCVEWDCLTFFGRVPSNKLCLLKRTNMYRCVKGHYKHILMYICWF